jgi:hypothetical protein
VDNLPAHGQPMYQCSDATPWIIGPGTSWVTWDRRRQGPHHLLHGPVAVAGGRAGRRTARHPATSWEGC